MQTDSSAMRTCIASASAVEWTATDLIPISAQARITRRAISPRLAIRIFSNMARLLDDHERGAVFDGRAVLDQDALHGARPRGRDLVHRLHRLDDEDGLAFGDLRADGDEGRRTGFGRQGRPCRPWARSRRRDAGPGLPVRRQGQRRRCSGRGRRRSAGPGQGRPSSRRWTASPRALPGCHPRHIRASPTVRSARSCSEVRPVPR